MTRKAYISCPLEAALAAINQKIMFVSADGNNLFFTIGDGEVAWYEEFITERRIFNEIYSHGKFFVNDNSFTLFDPVVGDIIFGRAIVSWSGDKYDYCGRIKEIDDQCYVLQSGPELPRGEYLDDGDESFRIIQRNGKPFPAIEYEDAE